MPRSLRIRLLGGFRCELDGRTVGDDEWRTGRARAVVKLLALAPGHRRHREELIDLLWPDLDPEAGSANLRKAVHFARQALGAEHLRHRSDLLALEADELWVDVEAFSAAADEGSAEQALELYSGDLLPEDRFEPWTEEPRARDRLRFQGLLLDHAADLERAGDVRRASELLERLVGLDPLNEEAVLGLMRTYAHAGRRHLALRQYSRLEAALREELGVEPGPELSRLSAQIASGEFPDGAHRAPPEPPQASLAAPAPPAGQDRIKLATVLMAEAATHPSGTDPERLRHGLDATLQEMKSVVEMWGGSVEPLVGGSLMAVFGVPQAHEDDAARALEAALDLVAGIDRPLRIGIWTGDVLAPATPYPSPREITGEAIVCAARLREAASYGAILASDRTRIAAGPAYRFSETLHVIDDGLRASRLEDRVAGVRAPLRLAPMVGRSTELDWVLSLFDDVVEQRRPRLVVISGVAGMGKTRLAHEVMSAVRERHPEVGIGRGRCLPAGRGSAYRALADVVSGACGIALGDPPDVVAGRLQEGVRRLVEGLGQQDVEALTYALATTAGIALPDNPLDRLGPEAVGEALALAWPRFCTACAANHPVLMFLEDLHWAEPPMLEMVERIAGRSSGRVMILVTARPELWDRRADLGGLAEGFAEVSLRPLTDAQSRELVQGWPVAGTVSPPLLEQVLARAEGNPYFLEELLLHVALGAWTALPDSLSSLLAARLDSLDPTDLAALQVAAVVGRAFWAEAVERGLPAESVPQRLARLESRGFVSRQSSSSLPGQAEFAFRHALMHDAAYESVPRARRARLHAEVAEWLEATVGDQRDEIEELVAAHWAWAALPEIADLAWEDPERREEVRRKAFEHLLRGGGLARSRFAVDAALDQHRKALNLAAGADERARALEEIGDDEASVYHGDAADAAYVEALDLVRPATGHRGDRARLCRKLAKMMVFRPGAYRTNPDPAQVEALIAEGQDAAEDDGERAWLLLVEGFCPRLYRGAEPFGQGSKYDPRPISERIASAERAFEMAGRLGLDELLLEGRGALPMLYELGGRYRDGLELRRRAVEERDVMASPLHQADALLLLAVQIASTTGAFDEALLLARESLELARGTTAHQLMHATSAVMQVLHSLGRWNELLDVLAEHLAAFRGEPALACQFVRDGLVVGAATLLLMGRTREADELTALVGDPLSDLKSASAWQARYEAIAGRPEVAVAISGPKFAEGRTKRPQHALALLEAELALEDWHALTEVVPVARESVPGNVLLEPVCDRAMGALESARGRRPQAGRLFARSLARFEELGVKYEAARTRELMAAVEPPKTRDALLSAASRTYEELGVVAGP